MLKFIRSKASTLIIAALFILFNVIFFLCVNLEESNASRWVAYGFIDLSFVIAICLTLFLKMPKGVFVDNAMPMISYTLTYFLINLIANIIFIAVNAETVIPAVIVNTIILVFYIILFIVAVSHISRVSEVVEKRGKQISAFDGITVKVYSLKDMCADEEVKVAIEKLTERLRYSSSASTPKSAQYEQQLDQLTDSLVEMIAGGADKDEIIKTVNKTNSVLSIRNHMLMM